jgi:hypothetical protein
MNRMRSDAYKSLISTTQFERSKLRILLVGMLELFFTPVEMVLRNAAENYSSFRWRWFDATSFT